MRDAAQLFDPLLKLLGIIAQSVDKADIVGSIRDPAGAISFGLESVWLIHRFPPRQRRPHSKRFEIRQSGATSGVDAETNPNGRLKAPAASESQR